MILKILTAALLLAMTAASIQPESCTALLGRPTNQSININLLSAEYLYAYAEYRVENETTSNQTATASIRAGEPQNMIISDLKPDTSYVYNLCYGKAEDAILQCSPEYFFHTQRKPGSSFIFDVQADSHLDERTDRDLYRQTLENELADRPDFLIDLGDTFMTEKLPQKNYDAILEQYLQQRSFIDAIGHSAPLYLVLGNHDGEADYENHALSGMAGNMADLCLLLRKSYFPNPEPDGFYSGNSEEYELTGLRQDYYSWKWGDALFVVLDPYWYTTDKPGRKADGWNWTLGADQYHWLCETLENSRAKFKFVFSHHLVGGDRQGRGGIENASLYEWGGNNTDGSRGFEEHRPGWKMPIHQVLARNNVTIFFHGHDHLFARQELDGVIYQEVPQPATISSPRAGPGREYGYSNGVMLSSPGHIRVSVTPKWVHVDYVQSFLPGDRVKVGKNGSVAYSYAIDSSIT